MRRTLSAALTGALTGAIALGVAWGTAGMLPVPPGQQGPTAAGALASPRALELAAAAGDGQRLPDGLFRVGAAKVSIAPKPVSEGGSWIRHGVDGDCEGQATLYTPLSNPSCLRTFDGRWATGVDTAHGLGVHVRAMTISNGTDTVAFAVMDTVGWFAGYMPEVCDGCGAKDISESLESSLGIPAENIVISSTHTHASADTVAASPQWYFHLVRDATVEAITRAHANARLATLETGSVPAKAFNTDRRIVTRAVPDPELGWLRAVATDDGGTVATMVNFSVHATITAGNHELHSGLVGHLDERLSERWGGTTLFMPAGLGDQTVNRGFGRDGFGYGLADLVVESQASGAYTLRTNEIVSTQRILQVPADNLSLVAANEARVFVRDATVPGEHAGGPATSVQQRSDANTPSCTAAAPLSALTPVGGIRIGEPGRLKQRDPSTGEWVVPPGDRGDAVVIMQAPGEIFSSISLTTKDYLSRSRNVMVIGLANDQIGYIIPAEQYDVRSGNAAGLFQPSLELANYEESLSTGRCTGDQVQNALIEVGAALGVLGDGESR